MHLSPWGLVHSSITLGNGITKVMTEGHGGLQLSEARQREVLSKFGPSPFLKSAEWWEQDLDEPLCMLILWPRLHAKARTEALQIAQNEFRLRTLRTYVQKKAAERFDVILQKVLEHDALRKESD